MREYGAQKEKLKLWKQNSSVNEHPTYPTTGNKLSKIPAPKMELKYIKCHHKEFRFSLRGKTTCPTNCLGCEVGNVQFVDAPAILH